MGSWIPGKYLKTIIETSKYQGPVLSLKQCLDEGTGPVFVYKVGREGKKKEVK